MIGPTPEGKGPSGPFFMVCEMQAATSRLAFLLSVGSKDEEDRGAGASR